MRISDWSSDVCSSDLPRHGGLPADRAGGDRGDSLAVADQRHHHRQLEGAAAHHAVAVFRGSADAGGRAVGAAGRAGSAAAPPPADTSGTRAATRSEGHTSELQSLMRISYAVFCLKKKKTENKRKTH